EEGPRRIASGVPALGAVLERHEQLAQGRGDLAGRRMRDPARDEAAAFVVVAELEGAPREAFDRPGTDRVLAVRVLGEGPARGAEVAALEQQVRPLEPDRRRALLVALRARGPCEPLARRRLLAAGL